MVMCGVLVTVANRRLSAPLSFPEAAQRLHSWPGPCLGRASTVEESLRQSPTHTILFKKSHVSLRLGPTRPTRLCPHLASYSSTPQTPHNGGRWLARRETSALMSLNDLTCQELARAHHDRKIRVLHLLTDLSLLESPRPGTPMNLCMHWTQPAPPNRGLNIFAN
jgi:hypothetical protein